MVDVETQRISRAFGALHGAGAFIELDKLVPGFKRPTELMQRLFTDRVAKHRGVLSAPERALLANAATAIREQLRANALIPLDVEDVVPISDLGWHDDHAVYLTGSAMIAIAQASGSTLEKLVDLLLAQGLLRPGRERGHQYRLPTRVPGRPRAYRISREVLRLATMAAP